MRILFPQARQFDFYTSPEVKRRQAALRLEREQKPLVCCYGKTDLLVVGFVPLKATVVLSHLAVPRINLPGTGLELNPVFSQPLGDDSSSFITSPSSLYPFLCPLFS